MPTRSSKSPARRSTRLASVDVESPPPRGEANCHLAASRELLRQRDNLRTHLEVVTSELERTKSQSRASITHSASEAKRAQQEAEQAAYLADMKENATGRNDSELSAETQMMRMELGAE